MWESIHRANQHIRIMREVKYQSNSAAKQFSLIITSLFVFIFMNRNRYDCVNPQTFYCCINSGMAVRIPFGINVKIILRILLKEKFPDKKISKSSIIMVFKRTHNRTRFFII